MSISEPARTEAIATDIRREIDPRKHLKQRIVMRCF